MKLIKDLPREDIKKKIEHLIRENAIFSISEEDGEIKKVKLKNLSDNEVFLGSRSFKKSSPRARQVIHAYYNMKKPISILDVMGDDWHCPDEIIITFEYSLKEKIKKLMKI